MLCGQRGRLRLAAMGMVLGCALARADAPVERLVLVGGGEYPASAIARFTEWSGGSEADILIIAWATEDPMVAFKRIFSALIENHPKQVSLAADPADAKFTKADFLNQLDRATGVFFTGGDQNRILDRLVDYPSLGDALRRRFSQGVIFGGSSAGTAIMSERAMTGKGDFEIIHPLSVDTRQGLGLLKEAAVDQHFLKRKRQNRLFSALLAGSKTLGLGIDEGAAISIENNRLVEVFGPSQVLAFDYETQDRSFRVTPLVQGERFDLFTRKRVGAHLGLAVK